MQGVLLNTSFVHNIRVDVLQGVLLNTSFVHHIRVDVLQVVLPNTSFVHHIHVSTAGGCFLLQLMTEMFAFDMHCSLWNRGIT